MILAIGAVSGCAEGLPPLAPDGVFSSKRAPARISVTEARVTVTGPRGYCIDPDQTRETPTSAFVLLGSCASITGSPRAAAPRDPALLTASVSTGAESGIAEAIDGLEPYFRSQDGRTALSRTGDAETVELLQARADGDAFFMHIRDTSEANLGGVQPVYWRALFDVDGAIVTASVMSFETRPLDNATLERTLREFVRAIRALNPRAGTPASSPTSALGQRVAGFWSRLAG